MELKLKTNRGISFQYVEKDISQQIGFNLITSRQAHSLTVKEAAKRLGIKTSTYHSYETGQAVMPAHMVARWSLVMGIPPHFIMKGTRYSSLIPDNERGQLLEKLQPFIGQQSLLDFEIFVRDICSFTGQQCPSFNGLELASKSISTNMMPKLLDELENDFYTNIAENIKLVRNKLKLSQNNMADLLQTSSFIYQRAEKQATPHKFQCTMSPRWWLATGVHPMHLIQRSKYCLYRRFQTEKLKIINVTLQPINKYCHNEIIQFAQAITSLRKSIYSN